MRNYLADLRIHLQIYELNGFTNYNDYALIHLIRFIRR
jgi:hypothetical protein